MTLLALEQQGIPLILALQAYSTPWLNLFFYGISELAGVGLLLILPLIIWCVDARLGLRAVLALILVQCLVLLLKDSALIPRPFMLDARIAGESSGYSFPSGHATRAMVLYGMLCLWSTSYWLKGLWVAVIAVVGVSRVYLGDHYPFDVLSGWLVGFVFLWVWCRVSTPLAKAFYRASPMQQMLLTAVLPVGVAVAGYFALGSSHLLFLAGALAALGISWVIEHDTPMLSQQGSLAVKSKRYSIGIVTLILVTMVAYGLSFAVSQQASVGFTALVLWINGFVMVWIATYIVPRLLRLRQVVAD